MSAFTSEAIVMDHALVPLGVMPVTLKESQLIPTCPKTQYYPYYCMKWFTQNNSLSVNQTAIMVGGLNHVAVN